MARAGGGAAAVALRPTSPAAATPDGGTSQAALDARLAALERDAFAKGFAQGERAGAEAAAQRGEAMLRRLTETLDELTTLRAQMIHQTEQQMVQLALAVARRVVHREVSLDQRPAHRDGARRARSPGRERPGHRTTQSRRLRSHSRRSRAPVDRHARHRRRRRARQPRRLPSSRTSARWTPASDRSRSLGRCGGGMIRCSMFPAMFRFGSGSVPVRVRARSQRDAHRDRDPDRT